MPGDVIPVRHQISTIFIKNIERFPFPVKGFGYIPNMDIVMTLGQFRKYLILPSPGVQILYLADFANTGYTQFDLECTGFRRCDRCKQRWILYQKNIDFLFVQFANNCIQIGEQVFGFWIRIADLWYRFALSFFTNWSAAGEPCEIYPEGFMAG